MKSVPTKKLSRTLGVLQGYLPLFIEDYLENGQRIMCSYWEPDLIERAALARGCVVRLSVLGEDHPPVRVEVMTDVAWAKHKIEVTP